MKTRHIPENTEAREFPEAAVVAYCGQQGEFATVKAYKGRQSRAAFFLAFRSPEQRDAHLSAYVERETAVEAYKQERQQARHGLAVGDILYAVWGYEQTNVTFYEVIRVPSERSATVQQIEADITEDGQGGMSGTSMPRQGVFTPNSTPETRRASGLHMLGGGRRSGGSLTKWDGRPRRVTWYG